MGCPIRSEIWGIICAGNPEMAKEYAYIDACLDHADNSVYAEQFLACIEAMAFYESDIVSLIKKGMEIIPSDSKLHNAFSFILNKYYENTIRSQQGNFMDNPTDCPQRDERMGWLGDAQIFCKAASYNFDVCRFFKKWLADVRILQKEDGHIPSIAPNNYEFDSAGGAAWSDAITIIPWQMYLTYGDTEILRENFSAMKKYVDATQSVFSEEVCTEKYEDRAGQHRAKVDNCHSSE